MILRHDLVCGGVKLCVLGTPLVACAVAMLYCALERKRLEVFGQAVCNNFGTFVFVLAWLDELLAPE